MELMAAIELFNYFNRFQRSAGDGAYMAGVGGEVGYDGCWCYDSGLAVVSQEVVDIESGSADGWFLIEASMGSMPVVLVGPWLELAEPFC